MRMTVLMAMMLAACSTSVLAADDDPGETCPEPKIALPDYPANAIRAGRQGTVVLEARFDDCGRVLEPRVKTGSRHRELDEAALAAAQKSVLSPEQRAEAVDGWFAWPVDFSVDSSIVSKPVDWPRTHRRAHYVLDEPLDPEIPVSEWYAQKLEMEQKVVRTPVLPLSHTFRQVQGEDGVEYWLFIPDRATNLPMFAMRYRTVMQDGRPEVRMSMRCQFPEEECESIQAVLRERGLPMSRPRD